MNNDGYFKLPSSWEWSRVREAGRIQLGRQRSPEHHTGEHMRPYLRVANVFENRIDTSDVLKMNFTPAEAERYLLVPGDILLNEGQSRELVGRPAMFHGEVPGACFQNTLVRFRAYEGIADSGYALSVFRYYFRAGHFQNICKWTTNIAHLGAERFASMPFPLAPLPEQKRIAYKLDALLARVDACRERLDRIPALLKRFRQSVLAAATSGELTREWREDHSSTETVDAMLQRVPPPAGKDTGRAAGVELREGRCALSVGPSERPLPNGWKCVPLMRLAKLESGHTPSRSKPSYWNGSIYWIGIKDARDHHGKVIHRTLQTVTQQGLDNSAARLLPAGTVCLSRTASVGYVTIMGETMATSQDFANWVCSPALLPEYLMYSLLAEGEGLRDFGEGTTHTTIYFPELKALHICLPPIEEQEAIVSRLKIFLTFVEQLEARCAAATGSVERLPASILSKAFRGELVPQDPNDEPASELLARIRKDHSEPGTQSKPKRSSTRTETTEATSRKRSANASRR